jgi:drug/metabolite transporter (DMT)-like permease
MIKGTLFGLLACFIWGLIFVIPGFIEEFSSLEVVFGRYFFYGLLSLVFFISKKKRYPLSLWIRALGYSLVASIIYYLSLVLALRFATPPIAAIILGLAPIPITLYGNWKEKKCDYLQLALPCLLLLIGLVMVNAPHFINSPTPLLFTFGLINGFIAFATWSWYAVTNAEFLKQNPHVRSEEWSTLMGIANLMWVLLFILPVAFFYKDTPLVMKYFLFGPSIKKFILGSMALGFVCSWVGGFYWNKASRILPISLSGQLLIFETVFGLLFVYSLEGAFPSLLETSGIVLLLAAVSYGVHLTSRGKAKAPEIT